MDLLWIGNSIRLKLVEPVGNMAAKCKKCKVNHLSFKFPHFYRFWEFPTNLNFVPTNLLKFPKLGIFPQSINTGYSFGSYVVVGNWFPLTNSNAAATWYPFLSEYPARDSRSAGERERARLG